jgi:peptidylprolyl isomerase
MMTTRDRVRDSLIFGVASAMLFSASTTAALSQTQKPQPPRPQAPAAAPAAAANPALAATEGAAGDSDVVARAGSARLTAADVRALIAQMTPRDRAAVERDPRVLSQTVRALLANQLVLKEALAKKWDQQPAVVAQLQRVHDEALVQTYLRSLSQPPDGFPGDSEVETAYEANKSSFLVPRQFQLAQIFIAQGPDADKAAEEKAKKKLEEVRKSLKEPGANFASIAARESDDPEGAAKGGDLGWLRENQIRPEIKSQIFGLAVNAISEPVRIEDGWHVFKLIDTKPAYTLPLSEVRELLQQRLREDRQNANQRRYLGKVADENPMTINEIALSKLIEPPASSSK